MATPGGPRPNRFVNNVRERKRGFRRAFDRDFQNKLTFRKFILYSRGPPAHQRGAFPRVQSQLDQSLIKTKPTLYSSTLTSTWLC